MKKKSGNITTAILVIAFIAGLSLLLYPTVSDLWNSGHQSRAIAGYSEKVATISAEEYDEFWTAAREYNDSIMERGNRFIQSDAEKETYHSLLNISGDGIMGYIDIPSIKLTLPIYHGTTNIVLQRGVGHLEWTSLPVGGATSHCVLSGHRGLPSAKLFTNLDSLAEGDTFTLSVLDEVLTYEVDRILIVDPQDTSALQIEDGKDYCTLVTCTPYGINTHRLLVRGHRIENEAVPVTVHIASDALQVDPVLISVIVGLPALILAVVLELLFGGRRRGTDLADADPQTLCEEIRTKLKSA